MKKRIIIMGAGVGGLSCAHALARLGYEVCIIERNNEVGGQARSKRLENGIHSEYCWHVIGKNYHNLWKILKEIPYEGLSVADNLKPISKYIYGRDSNISNKILTEENSFLCSDSLLRSAEALYKMGTIDRISLYDIYKLIEIYFIVNCNSLEELKKYDNVLWKDYTKYMSREAKKWIADSPAIYLGMDIDKLSAHTMFHLLRPIIQCDRTRDHDFFSFDGPFNEKWFEPWRSHLIWEGIRFYHGTINKIKIVDNEIKYVTVNDEKLYGDVFVNGLSIESLANLIPYYKELETKSVQIQTQVLYYIDKKLETSRREEAFLVPKGLSPLAWEVGKPTIIILPDTAWCIMVRVEGDIWENPDVEEDSLDSGYTYKDILSVGIGIWSRKGILGKEAMYCSLDEIKVECWEEIKRSEALMKYIKIEGGVFSDVNIVYTDVWYSFSRSNGTITTWEPKFSNNVGTLGLRPTTNDKVIKNLKHATAYTLTNANIFNMESACEAGCRTAKEIDERVVFIDKRDAPSDFFKFVQNDL